MYNKLNEMCEAMHRRNEEENVWRAVIEARLANPITIGNGHHGQLVGAASEQTEVTAGNRVGNGRSDQPESSSAEAVTHQRSEATSSEATSQRLIETGPSEGHNSAMDSGLPRAHEGACNHTPSQRQGASASGCRESSDREQSGKGICKKHAFHDRLARLQATAALKGKKIRDQFALPKPKDVGAIYGLVKNGCSVTGLPALGSKDANKSVTANTAFSRQVLSDWRSIAAAVDRRASAAPSMMDANYLSVVKILKPEATTPNAHIKVKPLAVAANQERKDLIFFAQFELNRRASPSSMTYSEYAADLKNSVLDKDSELKAQFKSLCKRLFDSTDSDHATTVARLKSHTCKHKSKLLAP